jgi:DNA gyrase subunit A
MICLQKEEAESRKVLVVSEKGFGKKTQIDEYRITNRGGKGVKTISITPKTGNLVGILSVSDEEDLVITCKSGMTIRMGVEEIREAGRATQGVKLIRLDDEDEIAAVSVIEKEEEESLHSEENPEQTENLATDNQPDNESIEPSGENPDIANP